MNFILPKSVKRTHFWSHIFFSMIAIFALPSVQELDRSFSVNPDYQNQSVYTQKLEVTLNQRAQHYKIQPFFPVFLWGNISLFQPHFVVQICMLHAPIRGSPILV